MTSLAIFDRTAVQTPPKWRAAQALRVALAMLPLLLLWPPARHAIEGRMSAHMLAEFPLLIAAGWAAPNPVGVRTTLGGTAFFCVLWLASAALFARAARQSAQSRTASPSI